MTKIEKRRLGVLAGALIIAIILMVVVVNAINSGKNKNDEKPNNNQIENNNSNNKNDNNVKTETIEEYEKNKNESMDIKGTQNVDKQGEVITNKSDKLNSVKKLNNVEISNVNVTYSNGTTKISGDIINKTDKDIDLDMVKINVIDNTGKVVKIFNSYIGNVKANSTRKLDLETQADISNLSDITFTK